MSNTPISITSLVIGEINTNEDQIAVQVNCDPTSPDLEGTKSFLTAYSKVIIPSNTADAIPLSGGAIVQVNTNNSNYNFKKKDTTSYDAKVTAIKEKIIAKYLLKDSALGKDVSFAGYKQLSDLKIALNRTFYEISKFLGSSKNFYEKDGVPEFILSTVFSQSTASDLQTVYSENIQKNFRDKNISPFASFQFIPFESILDIYSVLSLVNEEAKAGPGTFVGNFNIKFLDIYKKLNELNQNPNNFTSIEIQNIISVAILEIFPLYRIGEEVLIAEADDKLQLCGYYTFFNSNFYIKMPDLSGRDSAEYYSNFTTREDNGIKESLFYILEILTKNDSTYEYCPLVLKYNQLPSLTLKDGEISYPENSGSQIDEEIIYTGLDSIYLQNSINNLNQFKLKYYLAPLIKSNAANNNIQDNNNKSLDKNLEINYSQPIEIATIPLDYKPLYFSTTQNIKEEVNNLYKKYKTIPLFENNTSKYGVTSVDTILSSINRPEIVITDRENNQIIDSREVLFYSTQQEHTRYIMSGNYPRFLLSAPDSTSSFNYSNEITIPKDIDTVIPEHWIELISLDSTVDSGIDPKDLILKLSSSGINKLKKYFKTDNTIPSTDTEQYFDLSDTTNKICFATYIIDDTTGQFVRLPGPNINISLGEAKITSISPNGYLGGNPLRTNDEISIEIIGENLESAEEALLVVGGTGDKTIANKLDPGFIATSNSVIININKKWSELTTNLGEFPVYLKVKKTKNKETNKDIVVYISLDSATSATLPRKSSDKVNFGSFNSIYYKPKGVTKDLTFTSINNNGPDSIPLLFSGNSAKIKIGCTSNIFTSQNKNNIFAYLALKSKALVETFGLKEDVISINIYGETYYSNKKIIWSFGDQNFSKNILSNFAEISIPGPIESGPYNVRALIDGPITSSKAYLIFSNEIFTSDSTILFSESDKYSSAAVLQLGSDDPDRRAFINPPYILGLIAKSDNQKDCICNFDISNIANANKTEKDSINFKIKKAIPSRMISESRLNEIRNEKISVQDTLDHLFIIFNAPKKDKKYYKDCYQFYIGSEEITKNLVGKITYLSSNIACAYFRGISSLNLNGYSDVSISIDDYEYNSIYGSELYTKVSKTLNSSDYEITTSNDIQVVKIKNLEARRIETYFSNFKQNSASLILPIIDSSGLTYYQKYGYVNKSDSSDKSNSSGAIYRSIIGGNSSSDLYIKFVSPIKIKPINLEITFGNLESTILPESSNKIFGAFLSDEIKKDGFLEENVIVVNSNTLDVIQNRDSAVKSAESILTETSSKVSNISSRNQEVLSNPDNSSDAAIALATSSNNSILDLNNATDNLQFLINDANATAAQITAAVEQVNSLMRQASALTDALSSANYSLSGIVDSVLDANIGPSGRSTSINSLNQYYTYLPESFEYDSGFISKSSDNQLFIIVSTFIEQTHVIEAKVPEIYSITTKFDKTEYFQNNFSNIKLGSSPLEIIVKVKGGDKDSKFELGGYRTSSNFIKRDGEFYIYSVILEPSVYNLNFSGSDCAKFIITNSNRNRLKAERVLDPTAGQDIEKFFDKAKSSIDKQSKKSLDDIIDKAKLKVGPVIYDKSLTAKEALKSVCDLSFHLTAEISAQLKFLKILYIPIKVIFCIIDVICALLNPVKLAFAVIRLFACLFDLILLLPQISMPVLFLTILLHILELLLCVIQKILGIIVAINETITALDIAVRRRDFESIKNLELVLNEHLLTIEADLQVIEPIVQILGLILELLQLVFSFPCQITQDEDEPACIDPSMLAGLIVGRVAPRGFIVPDAMIPLAQDYTNLSVERTGENGNTPDSENNDPEQIIDVDYNNPPEDGAGNPVNNVLYKVSEAINNGTYIVVPNNTGYAGNPLPDLIDSQTNENKVVLEGGYFSGDQDGDGFIDNINYGKLRFNGGTFDGSFGISCTKSKKRFSFGTATLDRKNDPRFVEFQFKSAGLTSDYAWGIIGIFFKKKIIDDLFTLDSPPAMLSKNGNSLEIHTGSTINQENIKLISPIDGFSDFIEYAGTGSNGTYTYKAKPLVADIEVIESTIDPITYEPITTTTTVTKTFGGIPSFAIVDEKFNVYFIEENGLSIRFDEINGIKYPVVDNIFAKMINFPAAETQKFDREERQVIRKTASYEQKGGLFKSRMVDDLLNYCAQGGNSSSGVFNQGYREELGDAILKMQANAGFFEGISVDIFLLLNGSVSWIEKDPGIFGSKKPIAISGDGSTTDPYTLYLNYRKLNDDLFLSGNPFTELSDDYVGVGGASKFKIYLENLLNTIDPTVLIDNPELFNFPYLDYGIYDFANGNWAENDDFQYAINTIDVYNFPQIYFVDLRQVADDIAAACGASQTNELLLDLPGFNSDFGGDIVRPYLNCVTDFIDFFVGEKGIVVKIREKLAVGDIPSTISVESVMSAYTNLVDCTNKAIDDSCKFVINPLNTTFKLIEDTDETDLEGYIDPSNIVTEVVTDGAVSTMPTITGAMEYASGIGDSVTIKAGDSATIQIIPRDSYDDEIIDSLDAREKIAITIVSDTTATGASIEKIDKNQDLLWAKNGSIYTAKITSKTPGKVTIKASICNVIVQAVTDRGISTVITTTTTGDSSDCIPDATATTISPEIFPPGALVKVDRILTVLFTGNQFVDSTDDSGNGTPSLNPQVAFTDMVN